MLGFVFDVDDTLYEQIIPFEKAYKKLFAKDINIEEFYLRSRYYSDEKFEDSRNGKMTMDEYHIYRVQKAAEDFGVVLSDEEALTFQKEYKINQGKLEMSEVTKELLDNLVEKNVALGVITNGPSEHQWAKVKALNVEKWINKNNIIVSYDVGVNKPDKRIFELMEKHLKLSKEKLFYIGDSLENDVVGANNAGWKVIWINRYNAETPKGLAIYKEVRNNEELKQVIEKIMSENI